MNYNILETYQAARGKTYYLIELIDKNVSIRFKFDSDISDDLIEEEVAKYIQELEERTNQIYEETNEESQN